jgi:chromosome segregation ATPase
MSYIPRSLRPCTVDIRRAFRRPETPDEKLTCEQAELAKGQAELAKGQAELASGKVKLKSGQVKLASGQANLASGQAKLASGQAKLASGQANLASGQAKLQCGQNTLKRKQAEHETRKEHIASDESTDQSLVRVLASLSQTRPVDVDTDYAKLEFLQRCKVAPDNDCVQALCELVEPKKKSED